MNFEITKEILDSLSTYINTDKISISTESKDWKGRPYKSDFVNIDSANNIGFEVFENEIIVFYFTDHMHFEDYSTEEEYNYIYRAKEFLTKLFTSRLRRIETYKGKKLVKDFYYFIYNNKDDEQIGGTFWSLKSFLNPFAKKTQKITTWIYDKERGQFASRSSKPIDTKYLSMPTNSEYPSKPINPNAIDVIDISDDCYIQIFKLKSAYTYDIMKIEYDDYNGWYYWAPLQPIKAIGLYDTKEKAIEYAMQEIGQTDS